MTQVFPRRAAIRSAWHGQYCGQLGKQDNCQVAVSLSVATHQGSLPIAYRLYLPKEWADDADRRKIAGVPNDICFQTKPEIALQQLREALADGVPPGVALMDPAYGNDSKLRAGISGLGLSYVAGILPTTMVWRPGEAPLPPASRSGRGRPGKRLRRDETHQPVSAKTLALELAADAWQQITWRDGSNTPLTSRFARWRVRPAHDDARRSEPAPEEKAAMRHLRLQGRREIDETMIFTATLRQREIEDEARRQTAAVRRRREQRLRSHAMDQKEGSLKGIDSRRAPAVEEGSETWRDH